MVCIWYSTCSPWTCPPTSTHTFFPLVRLFFQRRILLEGFECFAFLGMVSKPQVDIANNQDCA